VHKRCRSFVRRSICLKPCVVFSCLDSGRSGTCVQTFYGHNNAVNGVAFSLAGDTIASCDADGIVKLWDVRVVTDKASLDCGDNPVNKVCVERVCVVVVCVWSKVLSLPVRYVCVLWYVFGAWCAVAFVCWRKSVCVLAQFCRWCFLLLSPIVVFPPVLHTGVLRPLGQHRSSGQRRR
jgi:hypothetical protein